MPKNSNFGSYLDHLIKYQAQLSADNNLCNDFIILYDYLIELLEKDDIIGEFVVRKMQETSSLNADVLLDLTKLFDVRSYIREPFLCLAQTDRGNKRFDKILHPFCNEKLSILPRNIKKNIWLALNRGILAYGSFVRGHKGDIYELNLLLNDHNDNIVRLNAFCDDINLIINLRILLKYYKNPYIESAQCKPFPKHQFNKEWLAKPSKNINMPFEICLPQLESEMQQNAPNYVMVMRLLRTLFKNNKMLSVLDSGFLESIVYSELMSRSSKNYPIRNDYILKGVMMHIYKALNTKKCPCFWNERLNLMKSFEDEILLSRAFNEFKNLHEKFNNMRCKGALKYEEFFDIFDFKMEPCSYEIDQFGIFKTY